MEQVSARLDMKNLKISPKSQKYQKMSIFAKYLCSIVFTFLRASNFVRLFMRMFNIFCLLEN